MLLPIGQDNTQFTCVIVNRMLLSVHWPEAEHRRSCYLILKRRDHYDRFSEVGPHRNGTVPVRQSGWGVTATWTIAHCDRL
jgi:hypothetical protein